MTKILCGKTVAKAVRADIRELAENYYKVNNCRPSLAIIQGGDRPDSNQYVRNKLKAAENNGIMATLNKIEEGTDDYFNELKLAVKTANEIYDGIIVQVPVPGLTSEQQKELINLIRRGADVDGMTEWAEGKFYTDPKSHKHTTPCTPMGIMKILEYYNISLEGKKVVIIGRSNIVGRPLAHLMMTANATVTVCHSRTPLNDIWDYINSADIVVCAIGKPEFINNWDFQGIDWSNKVLIDVGTNRVGNEWFGDISQQIKDKSYAYTPVPGGVGPMTITSLLQKVIDRAK